jgi:hypothetical protein
MLTLLYGYSLARTILPLTRWPKKPGELLRIVSIKLIGFIDALPIFEGFYDRNAHICLKRDNPEAQKRLWLHYFDRTPYHGFNPWSGMNGLEGGVFEELDSYTTENVINTGLTKV